MMKLPAKAQRMDLAGAAFCLILVLFFACVISAHAQTTGEQVVRVGWDESPFNFLDQSGRRTGYAYDYQQKIAAYTGWTYKYVTASWPDLLQMLKDGEIDLLSDVSYTAERAEQMLYPALPMGSESYYLFISNDNAEITTQDVSSLNGKRIGVNKNSIQEGFYLEWAKAHGIEAELIELTTFGNDSIEMMNQGEIDAFVSIEGYGSEDDCVPVFRIGSSDFYFAVNKDRPDLLRQLDYAMSRVWDENRYYNMQLADKYLRTTRTEAFISPLEAEWLTAHGPIRVGYRDNYLPFSAADKETGALTGALKDYLSLASGSLKNAELEFETIAYPTVDAALKALNSGEVDCVFPVNLSAYDGEVMNIVMTVPFMDTEMHAVMKNENFENISSPNGVSVAVNRGNNNYEAFLREYYPNWKIKYYDNVNESLKAVSENKVDCLLVSNYRVLQMDSLLQRYKLSAITTGHSMIFSFAVRKNDDHLYSILNKTANLIPENTIDMSLISHSYEEKKTSLLDFLRDNWVAVLIGMVVLFAVIIFQLLQRLRAERAAFDRQKLIAATELDPLTKLYNRNFFFEYANRMHRDHPEKPMDAIVLDIDQFHSVNAMNGRDFGDSVLKLIGSEVSSFLNETEGIAGRFEADRFDVFCVPQKNYQDLFARLQVKLNELSKKANVRLRMGVAPWQEGVEPIQLFDRARIACSKARGSYKNRLSLYDEKMSRQENLEQKLLNDLRRAVEEHEFQIYYQPKYDIQAEQPRLRSAEALIRWNHPELGLIPPDDFVPLFERNGQIGGVDNYVWTETARQIASWRDRFGIVLPVSVNLSRVDVFDPELETKLDELLSAHGLDHSTFNLEVTESAYVEDAKQVIRVVKRLRDKGFQIEMDDFGTGYSSLNMISSMPIDVLKIDKVFVRNIEHSRRDLQIVKLILDIAGSLKVPVVAEGVETEQQMILLKNLGCQLVQGYYFSKPLPPKEFDKLLLKTL